MVLSGDDLLVKAREHLEKGENLDVASEYFNKLLDQTIHGNGNAQVLLFYLACTSMKRQEHALAIILFKECLNYDADFIEAINNLGYIYKNQQLTDEASKCFDRVLLLIKKKEEKKEITPENMAKWIKDKSDYLTNSGSVLIANGTPKEAIKYFDQALELQSDNALSKWNRSLAYLELGNYQEGFRDYDFGDRMTKTETRNYGAKDLPLWDGSPGHTVVVYGEQGIGDELMFASVLPDVMKDCNIILDAHPRLADFFRSNFPSIPVYGTRKVDDAKIGWSKYHKPTAKIGIGSLCKFYRKNEVDFQDRALSPYLKADDILVEKYKSIFEEMGDKPKIGISWRGGTLSTNGNNRFIPLDLFLPILKMPEFDFISLQYHKDAEEGIKYFEETNQVCINHWQDILNDYDETAALVCNLDLIISVPQSVVHLAGSLGVLTWQLVPFKAMWQMGVYGKDMPWYRCVENIWQDKHCKWESVINKVKGDLCSLYRTSTES